jgi:hypothetical protein
VLAVAALAAVRGRQALETPDLAAAAAAVAPARQVHFQTPGGTRIVWVLHPARPLTTDNGKGAP